MKNILCCFALSALSALGGTPEGSGAPLRIYTDFQRDLPASIYSAMQRELRSLVSPIGLQLDWKSLASPGDRVPSAALVVVGFKGRCDVQGLEASHVDSGVLAWTHISDEEILPFVDVDCDHLREFLQSRLMRLEFKERQQVFGRAMARVLGHELFHVFAGTRHHSKEGVAQSAFTVSNLLSEEFGFAEKEFRTLRSTKLKPLLSAGKSSPINYATGSCAACHGVSGEGTRLAPSLRGAKNLAAAFEKKSEDMYRRARNLKIEWTFLNDEELREIVAALGNRGE